MHARVQDAHPLRVTHKAVKAGFWPWLSGKTPQNDLSSSEKDLGVCDPGSMHARVKGAHPRPECGTHKTDFGLGFQVKVLKNNVSYPLFARKQTSECEAVPRRARI